MSAESTGGAFRELTATQLAEQLRGTLEGDGSRVVRRVDSLATAGEDAVAWLGSTRYVALLAETRAGVILIPNDLSTPSGRTVIRVADPDLAMADALRLLGPTEVRVPAGIDPTASIDPTAQVDPAAAIGPHVTVAAEAKIGPQTQLHAGVFVGRAAEIGAGCVLWPNVIVRERVRLGDRVIIHGNTTIGSDGFGYLQRAGRNVKIPQVGIVQIDDDVEIGANCCVDRARSGVTRIRRGVKIDNLVQIGHNVDIGEDCVIVAQCGVSGSVSLGDHVMLAGQVGVVDHVRIGPQTVVSAQSGVASNLEGGTIYGGSPAVAMTDFRRQLVAIKRLPKILEQLRELEKRLARLESTTDDRPRG